MLLDLLTDASFLDVGNLVNREHPLARGLVAWWLTLPHRSGGTRWVDLVGTQHATLTSAAASPMATSGWGRGTRRPGGFGEIRLDGTDDRVTIPDSPALSFVTGGQDQPFTVHLSVWLTGITPTQGVVSKWAAGGTNEWICYVAASVIYFELYQANAGDDPEIGRTAPLTTAAHQGQWITVTLVYSGSETVGGIKIYLNGRRADTASTTYSSYTGMLNTTAIMQVGAYAGAANFLAGKVDDVRVYRRELSAGDVSALVRNSCQGYPDLLNRLPLWPGLQAAPVDLFPVWRQYGMSQAVHRAWHY